MRGPNLAGQRTVQIERVNDNLLFVMFDWAMALR